MADARFFDRAGPFSLETLARVAGADIAGAEPQVAEFTDVFPLQMAGPRDVSFIDNRRYVNAFRKTNAGLIIVAPDLAAKAPPEAALLVTGDPYRGYAKVSQLFYPIAPAAGHSLDRANVSPSAQIGERVVLREGAVIGDDCIIGSDSIIGEHTVIGRGVRLGDSCQIGPNCTLICCTIGAGVILHPGVRIGQDGFGFAPGAPEHEKVPQLGAVIVEDNVEIGANTTIDRGAGPDTIIGAGTKIDNLCQIGHNVELGKGCLLAAQVGISGSAKVGNYVMIGGQAGIAGHLNIGDGAKIAAKSGVTKDIPAGMTVAGYPAIKSTEHWRNLAAINRLRGKDKGR
jgi:UDP-3-O-[3-hydroxymyristoyl] glucosamine N-acyltransferase